MSLIVESVSISNTEKHNIESKYVNDDFSISISLPKNYYDSDKIYPVLFLLDANIFYGLFTDTARLLQYGNEIPELIVVGIGYPNENEHLVLRNRDYLPTYNKVSEKSGKAECFLDFMHKELMPFVGEKYRVNMNDSSLVGDSYSGLFALYALFNNPKLFNRYIIGSPSIYWDDRVILDYEQKYAQLNENLDARVFLSVGELEAIYEPAFARMVSNVVELNEVLVSRKYAGLELTMHRFEGETHLSVIPATMSRGLREIFK